MSMEEFVRKVAAYHTYEEEMAKAEGDFGAEIEIRHNFLDGIEDDWDAIVKEARALLAEADTP
jgi:hypothetical protein